MTFNFVVPAINLLITIHEILIPYRMREREIYRENERERVLANFSEKANSLIFFCVILEREEDWF